MTFRAVRILQDVDLIAAEDTRHTGKLLQHFAIDTPQISYHEHNRQARLEELLARLAQGKSVALVSDAGMPGISDPGHGLIQACLQATIPVVPIPGPTAAITALCISGGLPTDQFIFEGFLPLKGPRRRQRLIALQREPRTIILYEAPHKLLVTLADLAQVLGDDRPVALARELTKRFEECWRGTLGQAHQHYQQDPAKGEFTLVIAGTPASPPAVSADALKQELAQLLQAGVSRSDASRQLAKTTGLPKQEIYQLSLSLHTDPQ
ncbi:Ribosomal RNA small subunit methyltransferase I [Halomicronema hongdechloris C2206]|uniref:Ribosomal RNA small subunit methyltransferase I n=1 Tax=Halomicronema hongdechloris C2206 TaxID=1641165 RepID=A0A1Z3HV12_9CYAN|nr:16S rRNA (cytidine(1402)-2'-O)-methyltransferase [Halomicronema hongdechloris]ASC74112.1 Ribosomal RNA small subunit methyltransferase I [Halomicronema hongdechloris C2206]